MEDENKIPDDKVTCEINCITEKAIKEREQNGEWFRKIGFASFLYSIMFTLCLFDNLTSITMPIWIAATIFYAVFVMKKMQVPIKKGGAWYMAGMMLLGISTAVTGNANIHFMNYLGFFLLLLSFLLHNFYDDKDWGFSQHFIEMFCAVMGAIGCIHLPFVEAMALRKTKRIDAEKKEKSRMILIGVLAAIPTVLILGVCLASADAVFEQIFSGTFHVVNVSENNVVIILMLIFGFFASYCGMRSLSMHQQLWQSGSVKQQEPLIAITFTSVISVLYLIFSVVQIIYLFLGFGALPEGMTYADYARTGFFQLLFVSIVNIFIVLGIDKYFKENNILKVLLMVVSGCTFVMIASSAYRMVLYIIAYKLTFLRIFVLVALAAIFFVMIGIVIHMFKREFALFRYSMVLISMIYIAFSLSHVDYFIAEYNLNHMQVGDQQDALDYISYLSTDAAPAIKEYLNRNSGLMKEISEMKDQHVDDRYDFLDGYEPESGEINNSTDWYFRYLRVNNLDEGVSVKKFNLSRYIAYRSLC